MKIMLAAVVTICSIMLWLGYENQSALEQCKAAGIQSNETCEAYAH